MEIKVECPCGARYQFEAEPVDGNLADPVNCPACGADGTELANGVIRQQLATGGVSAQDTGSRLRVALPTAKPADTRPEGEPETAPVPMPSAATGESVRMRMEAKEGPNLALGVVGAVVAGFVGMMAWFLLIKWTEYEIGYAAWGVGVLTGLGARMLAKEGSVFMGVIAGGCALVAIIGGQFLAVKSFADEYWSGEISGAYEQQMAYAQEGVNAKSDEQIRAFLAKQMAEEEGTADPAAITSEDIQAFRENQQPEMEEFVNGKPTRKEYEANLESLKSVLMPPGVLLRESLSLWTALWLFLGVGSAFKIAASDGD